MSTGFLYVLKEGDGLKVGYSASPEQRLSHFRANTWRTIDLVMTIPGYYRTWEQSLQTHPRLAPFCIRGEWYRDCDEFWETFLSLTSSLDALLDDRVAS